jgi:hypothetical protein
MALMTVHNHNEQGKDYRSQPRWSAGKKTDAVLRLPRGASLEELSRELEVEAHRLAGWRDGVEALWILTRVRRSRSQPGQQVRSAPPGQPDPATSPPSHSSHPRPPQGRSRAVDDLPGDGR